MFEDATMTLFTRDLPFDFSKGPHDTRQIVGEVLLTFGLFGTVRRTLFEPASMLAYFRSHQRGSVVCGLRSRPLGDPVSGTKHDQKQPRRHAESLLIGASVYLTLVGHTGSAVQQGLSTCHSR